MEDQIEFDRRFLLSQKAEIIASARSGKRSSVQEVVISHGSLLAGLEVERAATLIITHPSGSGEYMRLIISHDTSEPTMEIPATTFNLTSRANPPIVDDSFPQNFGTYTNPLYL